MSPLTSRQETTRISYPDHSGKADESKNITEDSARDRQSIASQDKSLDNEEYGGVRVGLAFLGWLTATGTAVVLAAVVAVAGAAVSLATNRDAGAAGAATALFAQDPKTVSILGAIVLLVVVFVAYCCGGYVAGRMAHFSGLKQGLAVWLWAVLITAGVVVAAALASSQLDMVSELNTLPRLPVSQGNVTTGGLVALGVVAVGSLAGALVGGLAGGLVGRRFHRKVGRSSLRQ